MNIYLKEYLEEKLGSKFIANRQGWVDVYITPLNRIDVTIVSDEAGSLDNLEVEKCVTELVKEYAGDDAGKYNVGFLEFYTSEEAEDLALYKNDDIKKKPVTWSDVVSLNKEIMNNEPDRPYRMICFYSYKGGVGRTTALVQVAYLLAKQGRNVVLIDLDIEAPSFHQIFRKWVDDPVHGVKYGLVDYLYERMVNVNKDNIKIQIPDIFVQIDFDEEVKGNIYVFPAAKKLSYEYIFKLTQLQANVVFENRYMEEIMEELERTLKFDTVLIDSRTGINQWGAFSLLGLADQTVFIASPNEENIEGLSSIIELMKRAGLNNYVVVMSKFETDSKSVNIARRYLDRLENEEQEFIGISYNPSFAVMQKYPFMDLLEPYKVLSDYIIEKQIVNFNKKFISNWIIKNNGMLVKDILERIREAIEDAADNMDCDPRIITGAEKKALSDGNVNIVAGGKENINRLSAVFKRYAGMKRRDMAYGERGKDIIGNGMIVYRELIPVFEYDFYSEFSGYIEKAVDRDTMNHGDLMDRGRAMRLWTAYLLYLINRNLERFEQLNSEQINSERQTEKKPNLKGYAALKGKGLTEYINFAVNSGESELASVLKEAIQGDILVFDPLKNNMRNDVGYNDVVVCMFNIHEVINSIYDNNSASNRCEYRNLYERELVRGLTDCILFYKKHVPAIRILFAHSYDFIIEHQEELADLKGSSLYLDWKENDVEKLIISCIDMDLFRPYADLMIKNASLFGNFADNEREYEYVNMPSKNESKTENFTDSPLFNRRVLDLFWGIRVSTKTYSKHMIAWFYDELKKCGEISDRMILDILKKAVAFEIAELCQGKSGDGDGDSRDRLITIESLKKAFVRYHGE